MYENKFGIIKSQIENVDVPVMLLHNILQYTWFCNSTRSTVVRLQQRVIEAEIITGNHVGS